MKKIICLCLLALAGQACKSILEEKIVSDITPAYYNTAAGFEDAVRASYEPLRSWYGTQRGFTLTVFGTDTYTKGADGDFKPINDYNTPNMISGIATPYFRDAWNDFYRAINITNTVIVRAPEAKVPDAQKAIRVAEAQFLRAHYYFLLVQMYGPIHINVEETTSVILTASRSPVNEVYDLIIKDLEAAIPALPNRQNDYGRVTRPAAEHMLARVYLTRAGTPEAAQPGDYAKAAEYAKQVIPAPLGTGTYGFALVPVFEQLWNQDNQENSEIIWAVQYTADPATTPFVGGGGNSGHLYFQMEYDAGHPGTQRDIANGRPFKRFKPTQYTLNLFDLSKDSRYHGSFKTVWYANNPRTLRPGMKIGDTAIYVPTFEMPADEVAKKNYRVINPSEVAQQNNYRYFPSLSKFLDPRRQSVQQEAGSRDFFVARLADTYLMAAEALMKAGDPAAAVEYINVVRRRAALPGKEKEMEITADQLNQDFILDERARELLGEQTRWFDLKRTGTLVERVRKYNPDAAPNIQEFHTLRPIPQDQIDRTQPAGSFAQNEGY
jgi:hypothetical protein